VNGLKKYNSSRGGEVFREEFDLCVGNLKQITLDYSWFMLNMNHEVPKQELRVFYMSILVGLASQHGQFMIQVGHRRLEYVPEALKILQEFADSPLAVGTLEERLLGLHSAEDTMTQELGHRTVTHNILRDYDAAALDPDQQNRVLRRWVAVLEDQDENAEVDAYAVSLVGCLSDCVWLFGRL
jgi:hypothetical protein